MFFRMFFRVCVVVVLLRIAQSLPNNRRDNLVPIDGAWRGATLGRQFESADGDGEDKVGRFDSVYPDTPLQLYRQFNTLTSSNVSDETAEWVRRGGILWYNIKFESWKDGAEGAYDEETKEWARAVSSLAPANVFVTVYHEPDHNVCFEDPCPKGGVKGNTPSNYRKMYARIQDVFVAQNVSNAVWLVDYSAQISKNATLANAASGCVDDAHCTALGAVVALWPGNDRVDWLFFNAFETDNKHLKPKETFDDIVGSVYDVLETMSSDNSTMARCVSGLCNFTALPWGLGAFASHGVAISGKPAPTISQRIQWFQDAERSLTMRPHLRAYVYFDSLDSQVLINGTDRTVDEAFRRYLSAKAFAVNDGGIYSEE